MSAWASDELAALEDAGLRRHPLTLSSAQEAEVEIDGRRVVLLCSNNYLGLAGDARVRRAAADAALRWGAGSGASRLVSGTTDLHRELERALAAHKGREDAVLFSSGYLANIGTIAALVGPSDEVFSDELNHASIIDGCRLSGAQRSVYPHADVDALDAMLEASSARRKLVVTDTVFSMDGDLAPLDAIAESCARHGALLMVDEAHATGLLGPGGGGAAHGLRADVVMGTLSKALGSAGGFVAGDHDVVELLRNRARTHVFDTAPAPASIGAALRALSIVRTEPWRRERALEVASRLASGLRPYGAAKPAAAVVPVLIGGSADAMRLSADLLDLGVFVPAIRPPSVPEGTARLRVCAMATHTDEHVELVFDAFGRAAGEPSRSRRRSPAPHPRGLFVTGTDTGVGKTVVAALIARALSMQGRRVAYVKPAQTGGDDDAGFVARLSGVSAHAVHTLDAQLAPAVAARLEHVEIDVAAIERAVRGADADVVVVEGAGGVLVPLTDEVTMLDLAHRLGLEIVVVARSGLGTINHTAMTVRTAGRVLGVVISGFPDDPGLAETTNPDEIERMSGAPIIGVVPYLDVDVDRGAFPPGVDPRPWLAPTLGGSFDRERFLRELTDRRADVART